MEHLVVEHRSASLAPEIDDLRFVQTFCLKLVVFFWSVNFLLILVNSCKRVVMIVEK
jgi:hypothetical protein